MRFSVPDVPDNEARSAWQRMRQACDASDTHPIYSITYEDEGTEFSATVDGEGVIAIIVAGEACYVIEAGEPRPVPWEMVFFDED